MNSHRSPAGGRAGRWALGLTLAGLLPVLAAPAAASADASLSCRASAARVTALTPSSPLATVEPVRANAGATPCTSQSAETLKPTTIGPLSVDAIGAYTAAPSGGGAAFAGASQPSLDLGGLKIGVQAVQASATVTCTGGNPVLSGASRVVGLTVNGIPITIPSDDQPFRLNLGVADVSLNEQTVANGQLIQRAVRVTVPGVADAVLAEAIVGGSREACTPPPGGTTPPGGGTTPPGGGPRVCPQGSVFDPANGVCIIRLLGSDRVIVIGPPYTGPSGGTVLPLPTARRRYQSPCLSGPGLPYAVVGTNRNDRITGTNGSDRILLLRGNDAGDGGRGNDCVDGGSGRDLVSGALGNDRLFGGSDRDRVQGGFGNDRIAGGTGNDVLRGDSGRDRIDGGSGNDLVLGGSDADHLAGGSGNDRVLGESGDDVSYGGGNDQVRAGYGHDRLYGGSGRDFMGAFLLGPTVRMVDGGSGRDTAWVNPLEVRVTRHVERVRILGVRSRVNRR